MSVAAASPAFERLLLTGAAGALGRVLRPRLKAHCKLLRVSDIAELEPAAAGEEVVRAALEDESAVRALLDGVDAVVHLGGETVAGRWTEAKKRRIRDSRVLGTRLLAETAAAYEPRPRAFVSASAIGYYGDRGDEPVAEGSPIGHGFLAGVVRDWEAAAEPARDAGIRVVNPRFGIVQSAAGGALRAQLPLFRLGLGGRVGSGRQ